MEGGLGDDMICEGDRADHSSCIVNSSTEGDLLLTTGKNYHRLSHGLPQSLYS